MDAIANIKGQDALAFNGLNGPAWHGKGRSLDGLSTKEEMIKASGLDWMVKKVPAEFMGAPLPGFFYVVRDFDQRVFNCVRKQYQPIQNHWLFDFLDAVIAKGEAVYESAGALLDGAVCFASAKLPHEYYICDDDQIQPYVVTALAHNKLLTFTAFSASIRVVCWNTLSAAINAAKDGAGIIKIPHRGGAEQAIKAAPSALGIAISDLDKLSPIYRDLAQKHMTVMQFNDFVETMFPAKKTKENKYAKNAQAIRDYLVAAWDNPLNNLHAKNLHTGWTAMNAVTQMIDHYQPEQKPGSKRKRIDLDYQAWFGTGPTLRSKALRVLGKMLLKNTSIEDEKAVDDFTNALIAATAELRQTPAGQLPADFPLSDADEDGNPLPESSLQLDLDSPPRPEPGDVDYWPATN